MVLCYTTFKSFRREIMKKLIFIFCFLFILTFQVYAQGTTIPPGSVYGTWTAAGSPYYIEGEIFIDTLDTLTIEPAVEVVFISHDKFLIYGNLSAEGTESDSVYFSAYTPSTGWNGLRFIDTNANGVDASDIVFCKIEDGKASDSAPDNDGGGIYLSNSTVTIQNTIITDNQADANGGGIYCSTGSNLNLLGVIIKENDAGNSGGGIYCWDAEIHIWDSEIYNNNASMIGEGGGIYLGQYSDLFIIRTVIHNNEAYSYGGGIQCSSSTIDAEKLTIYGNLSGYSGGGINVNSSSDVEIVNSILWNNSPDQINESTRETTVTYSDVQTFTAPWTGEGNIMADPLFVDASNNDFHLTMESPCIDTGDPDSDDDEDGTVADMGAYYYHHDGTFIHGGDVDGTWDIAGSPYYILGEITIPEYNTLTINSGVNVIFMGHYKFIIEGAILASGEEEEMITFTVDDTTGFSNPATNAGGWHGLRFAGLRGNRTPSELTYCHIEYGKAVSENVSDTYGGGIFIQQNTNLTLSHSILYSNFASNSGGGIAIEYLWGSVNITDNLISHNSATAGAGIYSYESTIDYENNIFNQNTASETDGMGGGILLVEGYYSPSSFDGDQFIRNYSEQGGGIFVSGGSPYFTGVVVRNNIAVEGGGLYLDSSSPSLELSAFKENIAYQYGGAIYHADAGGDFINLLFYGNEAFIGAGIYSTSESYTELFNTTFTGNIATDMGGAFYCSSANHQFKSSILWNNYPDQINIESGTVEVDYSDVQGGYPGTDNLDIDPNFVNPSNNNYHLSPFNQTGDDKNPLVDAGDPFGDWSLEPDPNGSMINMGAYGGTDEAAISITFANGNVDGDQEWESDEMQVVTENVTISNGVTLTIQSGAFIDIQDPAIGFEVNGSILLQGNSQEPIRFGPNLSGGSRIDTWQGITFTNFASETSVIDHVIIENAVTGIDLGGNSIDIANTQILYDTQTRETSDGTGIIVGDDSDPTIDNCDVENYSKGIETKNSSTPTITNSRVRNNPESTRQDEIGIEITDSASPLIEYCEIDSFPTGIKIDNQTRATSTPTLTNSRVRNNPESTRDNELGIVISGPVEMTIDNCDIEDYPYGIRYLGTGQPTRATPTLTNSRVRNNPESTRDVTLKTGIFIEDLLNVVIDSCDIYYYNTAVDIQNDVWATATPTLTNSRVRNSPESTRDEKIGLRLSGDLDALIEMNEFVNCDSALIINGLNAHCNINHNLIYMIDLSPIDNAIYANLSDDLEIFNNSIYDYTYGFVAENVTALFYNNIIWNTDYPITDIGSTLNVDYNNITGGYAGVSNINADPMFVDTANEDFHLLDGSPCIDTGDPSSPLDPDGTRDDIGRFYFPQQPTPVVLSSFNAAIIDNSPTLNWTTQSETDNLGWNVYRSDSDFIEQSSQINQQLIDGAGTTTEPTHYEFTDGYDVAPTNTYWYWLESVNSSSQTDIYGPISLTIPEEFEPVELPEVTELFGNFPNPFHAKHNPTSINFAVKEGEIGTLTIYNVKGQQIEKQRFEPGNWDYTWKSEKYSSGIFFYKLETKSYTAVKKMILLR